MLLCVATPSFVHPVPVLAVYPHYHLEREVFPWGSWVVPQSLLFGIPMATMAMFLVLPVWWVTVKLRELANDVTTEKRKARGFCIHCGYDLRATSRRCPECGALTRR